MMSRIETIGGKRILRVIYDPATRDWNACIEAALAHYRLERNQVIILATPEGGTRFEHGET